jgi:peptide/nickel transport system substrate-binding protein
MVPIRKHRFHSARRGATGAAAVLLAIAGLAACSAQSTTAGQRDDIILGRAMDLTTLDPDRSLCDTCQIYNSAVYDTLIKANAQNGHLDPLVADRWEVNDNATQFTFHLHPGAVFADGSPIEAKDVKWTWERVKNLAGAPSYFMAGITGIDTPDAETVVVHSKEPNSAFPAITSASYMGIVNSDLAAQNGATADDNAATTDKAEQWFLSNSAGSGQYQLDSYKPGSELVLTRNDKYWGPKAAFSKVTIKEVSDSSSQLQQLQQGDIDVAMQLSFDALDQIKSDPKITSQVVDSYNFVYIALSPGVTGGEKLADPRVREAIRKAIDYNAVIDATVAGNGKRQATGIANGFEGTSGLALPEYDPEGAKSLLSQAGFGSGLQLEAVYPNFTIYGVDFNTMFQSVQQSLKKSGIDLKLTPMDYTAWSDRLKNSGIPITSVYFAPDHPDTIQYVQYFSLMQGSTWAERARLPISKPETDSAAAALSETGAQREKTYAQLGDMMWNDSIILPIVNPKLILASSADVTGNNYHITRNLDLSVMGFKH